jgi:hypothetical protein
MDNEIKNNMDTIHYASSKKPYLLYGSVKKLLTNVRDMDSQTMDSITRKIGTKNYEQYHQATLLKQIDQWERDNGKLPDGRKEQLVDETLRNSQNAVRDELRSLQWQLKSLDEKSFTQACQYLSYPRGNWVSRSSLQSIYRVAHNTIRTIFSFGKPNLKELGVDLAGVRNYYSSALQESSSPWMKTPSLIISYNSPRLTGGHNLSSKIRRVNSIDADKAIIASGRPQVVPRDENTKPTQPKTSTSPTSSTPSTTKPVTTSPKTNPPPQAAPSSPVRSRSDVIPTTGRTTRGF